MPCVSFTVTRLYLVLVEVRAAMALRAYALVVLSFIQLSLASPVLLSHSFEELSEVAFSAGVGQVAWAGSKHDQKLVARYALANALVSRQQVI